MIFYMIYTESYVGRSEICLQNMQTNNWKEIKFTRKKSTLIKFLCFPYLSPFLLPTDKLLNLHLSSTSANPDVAKKKKKYWLEV